MEEYGQLLNKQQNHKISLQYPYIIKMSNFCKKSFIYSEIWKESNTNDTYKQNSYTLMK